MLVVVTVRFLLALQICFVCFRPFLFGILFGLQPASRGLQEVEFKNSILCAAAHGVCVLRRQPAA